MIVRRPVRSGAGRSRAGYTLIELLVASAIATLLMLALYSSFDLTVNQTDIGRERVAHTDLARAVVNRLSSDLSGSLGLLPPQSGQKPAQAAGGGATMMTTDPSATTEETTAGTLLNFQGGVIGDNQQLTLFVSKVPVWHTQPAAAANAEQSNAILPPDSQRVTYYLASDGRGLCRQSRPWITATGTGDTTALDTANEVNEVIAPEVTAVTFEYLDGTGWTTSWDGTGAALDDSAVLGPPRAIRVTLTFTTVNDVGAEVQKTVQHVFPVRAAIGLYTPPSSGG